METLNNNINFDNNDEAFLVLQIIKYTNQNVFLCGKAGTGKSTFLKYTIENISANKKNKSGKKENFREVDKSMDEIENKIKYMDEEIIKRMLSYVKKNVAKFFLKRR